MSLSIDSTELLVCCPKCRKVFKELSTVNPICPRCGAYIYPDEEWKSWLDELNNRKYDSWSNN